MCIPAVEPTDVASGCWSDEIDLGRIVRIADIHGDHTRTP